MRKTRLNPVARGAFPGVPAPHHHRPLGLLFALAAAACGGQGSASDVSPGEPNQPDVDDLRVGDNGPAVRAVNEYLTAFGYFPNDDLARQHPAWRPIVAQGPRVLDEFDEHTRQAVSGFQTNMGIPVTGVVDASTRSILQSPRCGIPDGMTVLDPTDKFALRKAKWKKSSLTLKFNPAGMPLQLPVLTVRGMLIEAASSWTDHTGLNISVLSETSTTAADITVQFSKIDGPSFDLSTGLCRPRKDTKGTIRGALIGRTTPDDGGFSGTTLPAQTIFLDVEERWSALPGSDSTFCALDLRTTIIHELGHALGLAHSSFSPDVMYPTLGRDAKGNPEVKQPDDRDTIALSSQYDSFVQLSATAHDIGTGADGSIWIIGADAGGQVRKFVAGVAQPDAQLFPGNTARIAVGPDGIPWVVDEFHQILRRTTSDLATGFWEQLPGLALDIALGFNGMAWIVGTNNIVYQWDVDAGTWRIDHNLLRTAAKIAVEDGGAPWIIDTSNHILRYVTALNCHGSCPANSPFTGRWESIPGESNDIAIMFSQAVWTIGGPVGAGLLSLSVWDEQQPGSSGAPSAALWTPGLRPSTFGPFTTVAARLNGDVIIIDGNSRIWYSPR